MHKLAQKTPLKPNNLDVLRLISASLVLYGHSFVFLGLPAPLFLSWIPLGSLGVDVFFIISGYLIAKSWSGDPNFFRYFARRGLRIFPGLTVCILFSVLVLGPVFTTWSLSDYFHDRQTWEYLFNIVLYISFYLPGVFETGHAPNAVNGSLWSLPIEFLMYIIVALIGLVRGNRWFFVALFAVSAAVSFFWAQRATQGVVFYAFDLRQVFLCGTYFWAGAVWGKFDFSRFFSVSAALTACFLMLCLEPWTLWLAVSSWVLLPLIVLNFGLSSSLNLSRITRTGDYSYGIYIYAFPVQQAVAAMYPEIVLLNYVVACWLITLIFAIFSFHLVERRALNLKPRRKKPQPKDADEYLGRKCYVSAAEESIQGK